MTEVSFRLPARKPSMALLARLDHQARDEFVTELLHALWDAHEAEGLPSRISVFLRDWLAHAHFEESPIVQERLAEARRRDPRN